MSAAHTLSIRVCYGLQSGDLGMVTCRRSIAVHNGAEWFRLALYVKAQVRRNFSETAFWTPAVVTDKTHRHGHAHRSFPRHADDVESHRAGINVRRPCRGRRHAGRHQQASARAPRSRPASLSSAIKVTLSAIVRNDLATDKQVRVSLTTNGDVLKDSEPNPGASADPSLLREG